MRKRMQSSSSSLPTVWCAMSTLLLVLPILLVQLRSTQNDEQQHLFWMHTDAAAFIPMSTTPRWTSMTRRHACRSHASHRRLVSLKGNTDGTVNDMESSVAATDVTAAAASAIVSYDNVYIMVNGMPGPMATAAAEACLRKGLRLAPVALTGPDVRPSTVTVTDRVTNQSAPVRLLPNGSGGSSSSSSSNSNREEILASLAGLHASSATPLLLLAIDYTHPSAVNDNGRFYVEQKIPFVMGTTGGDREQLLLDVQGHDCVIAPNMGKQIVAMQAALEDLGAKFPGAFAGYTLNVVESHQTTKADTSGTAKAVIDSIRTLTNEVTFTYDDIAMIRNEEEAMATLQVPESALKGHAFHTYTITSPDQSVQFELKHNVAGRTVYAEGTADAVKFLARKVMLKQQQEGANSAGRVYTMIDVLKEGALE